MKEKEVNNIIRKSLDWGYKIPDDGSAMSMGIKRPFDVFGIIDGRPIYIESKAMNKMESFNLGRIRDHQIKNLLEIKKLNQGAICAIALSVNCGRAKHRLYLWTDVETINTRRNNKENFKKVELEKLNNFVLRENSTCINEEGFEVKCHKYDLRKLID